MRAKATIVAALFGALILASPALPHYTPPDKRHIALHAVQKAFCGHVNKSCRYSQEAMKVVYCETGGTYSVWSRNGQYLGLFQMGSWERATYGHGNNAWVQARAAHRYFVASGSDWSPWECKPW